MRLQVLTIKTVIYMLSKHRIKYSLLRHNIELTNNKIRRFKSLWTHSLSNNLEIIRLITSKNILTNVNIRGVKYVVY